MFQFDNGNYESSTVMVGVLLIPLILYFTNRRRNGGDNSLAASSHGGDQEYTPPQQCPNPDCIRCHKYRVVNEKAKQKIAWIRKDLEGQYPTEGSLDRIVEAVQRGRKGAIKTRDSQRQQYPTVLYVCKLQTRPFVTELHESTLGPLLSNEKLRAEIYAEYIESQKQRETTSWLQNDTPQGEWNVCHLLNQGLWISENQRQCPKTTNLILSIPQLLEGNIFGNAFFSVVQPGTRIAPHCGPTNARHRLQWILQNAAGQTPYLTVGGEQLQLPQLERNWFVFDDSIAHSVEYYGKKDGSSLSPRVVLIVDLWHPGLTKLEKRAIQELYAPG